MIRVNPYPFERMAGRKLGAVADDAIVAGAARGAPCRAYASRISSAEPPGAQRAGDDQVDVDAFDVHVEQPASGLSCWMSMHQAYHRYLRDHTSADTRRLEAVILAHAGAPDESARAIIELAGEDWVAGVRLQLPRAFRSTTRICIHLGGDERSRPADHPPQLLLRGAVLPRLPRRLGQRRLRPQFAHVWGAQRLLGYVLIVPRARSTPRSKVRRDGSRFCDHPLGDRRASNASMATCSATAC